MKSSGECSRGENFRSIYFFTRALRAIRTVLTRAKTSNYNCAIIGRGEGGGESLRTWNGGEISKGMDDFNVYLVVNIFDDGGERVNDSGV